MSGYDREDLTRLFRTKITVCECGCWLFSRVDRGGYSSFKLNGRNVVGHRYAYRRLVGEIPDGFDIDHLCDRHRNCVNPAHMEAVPKRVNALRANERKYGKAPGTYDDTFGSASTDPVPENLGVERSTLTNQEKEEDS